MACCLCVFRRFDRIPPGCTLPGIACAAVCRGYRSGVITFAAMHGDSQRQVLLLRLLHIAPQRCHHLRRHLLPCERKQMKDARLRPWQASASAAVDLFRSAGDSDARIHIIGHNRRVGLACSRAVEVAGAGVVADQVVEARHFHNGGAVDLDRARLCCIGIGIADQNAGKHRRLLVFDRSVLTPSRRLIGIGRHHGQALASAIQAMVRHFAGRAVQAFRRRWLHQRRRRRQMFRRRRRRRVLRVR
ncbi:hypothetical protein XTPLMG730_2198 [Xanthomonas translucens pv. phlei]|uniref:Uncharacterized protein n=1 Tax=Xanthomonas graminis pv. phlei TaxID=487906 RepID=A0A0K2ZUB2_9XANT|nr:hypothetical protein XTPLMG730_2198 [Xanthomonas translucens pv. phlei]